MNPSVPFISVVVPAYNRPDGLKALLDALAEQSYPPYRFEVLICDDGSMPPLAERVAVKEFPFSVRFLRDYNQGPATARNRGLKEARGSLVAFTDDDCLPAESWLEAIATALGAAQSVAVHGPTRSSVPPIEPFIHSIHIDRIHGVATANFAARKERLLSVGGFDETFTVPYFEDEDLSRRMQEKFGAFAWAEGMQVDHPPRPGTIGGAWRAAAFYRFLPYMQGKYPGYWEGAMPAVRKRVLAKALLVGIGLSPALGAPASLAVAWLGILAWQAHRLQKLMAQASGHGAAVPLTHQLVFLAGEWLLDFRRWIAFETGRGIQKKPAPIEIEELQI